MKRVSVWQLAAFLLVIAEGEGVARAQGELWRSVVGSPIFSNALFLPGANKAPPGPPGGSEGEAANDSPWLARAIKICRSRRAVAGVRPPSLACPLFLASGREDSLVDTLPEVAPPNVEQAALTRIGRRS
jgi:hypothetical protein